jgi:peptidoglycan/LPS O-acetylase OafA/YrhL
MLLVQSWVPSQAVYYSIVGVAWSLSCEAFFYAAFPFVLPRVTSLSPTTRRKVMVLLVILAVGVPLLVHSGGHDAGVGFWLLYIFPPTRLLEFLLGMLLALEVRDGRRLRMPLPTVAVTAGVALVVAGRVPIYLTWVAVTLVPYLLLVRALAEADLDDRPSWLRRRSLVWLGERSYALYLVHQLLLAATKHVVPHLAPVPAIGLSIIVLAAATACAHVLYTVIEIPVASRFRRRPAAPHPQVELATSVNNPSNRLTVAAQV